MNTDDEFNFDAAPTDGATLTDQQPDGAGSDPYAAASDVDMSGAASGGPTETTKCKGSMSRPRLTDKDGRQMVIIDCTVFEPAEHAGYEAPIFCTTRGGKPNDAPRGLKDLAKICKTLNVASDGKLNEVLGRIAAAVEGRDDIPFSLAPKKSGDGHFVNV